MSSLSIRYSIGHSPRSFSGMVYAAKRLGLKEQKKAKKKNRVHRRYPKRLECRLYNDVLHLVKKIIANECNL